MRADGSLSSAKMENKSENRLSEPKIGPDGRFFVGDNRLPLRRALRGGFYSVKMENKSENRLSEPKIGPDGCFLRATTGRPYKRGSAEGM